ncbi:MAG TPA: nuclear transport factor 2 family protein, partial [Steroidobacteraceae bacterium]|nr:nuclear transport factor 2 family protein [Steroidobacteraceae bacterium]
MNDAFIRCFVESFAVKDVTVLDPFLHPNIVFQNYEDAEVRGKDKVLDLWKRVFGMFEVIRFETLHQAVNGDVIIAEQMHGLS